MIEQGQRHFAAHQGRVKFTFGTDMEQIFGAAQIDADGRAKQTGLQIACVEIVTGELQTAAYATEPRQIVNDVHPVVIQPVAAGDAGFFHVLERQMQFDIERAVAFGTDVTSEVVDGFADRAGFNELEKLGRGASGLATQVDRGFSRYQIRNFCLDVFECGTKYLPALRIDLHALTGEYHFAVDIGNRRPVGGVIQRHPGDVTTDVKCAATGLAERKLGQVAFQHQSRIAGFAGE